ncbi:MAG: FAD-dependent oxidoreductase [Cytophagaceae bacterium]|nr:FAD-dependent oxidoreductase [Gemmatimonadaceae bacterium]
MTDRRQFVTALAGLPLAHSALSPSAPDVSAAPSRPIQAAKPHIVVVGAGAFGGWTALSLLRAGARVTLLDAYGAGNSRASSGGETRVIRGVYNGKATYIDMVARALVLWKEAESRWQRRFYHRTGALWMFEGSDDAFARTSVAPMKARGLPLRELALAEAARLYPQVRFDGVRTAWLEQDAGFLLARASCEAVREAVVREGGDYRVAQVRPVASPGGRMARVGLSSGGTLSADTFVFACGPWMGRLFPQVIGDRVRATRQEVFFFGPPAGSTQWDDPQFPCWVNFGEHLMYGIPGNERRGFKVADDTPGSIVDPDTLDRVVTPASLSAARALLKRRFPGLAAAPVVETRVCQYESSTDGDFIVDRHPTLENVFLLGGGSGHGFKMGPAFGEHAAAVVQGRVPVLPMFALKRLANPSAAPTTRKA